MGVPSGATITGITSASLYSKCVTYVVGSGSAVTAGTATLSDGTTTVTLASQRTITATDSNYVQQTGTNNTSLNWASTQNVTITINQLVNGGNNGSAAVDVRVDDLALTIAYTEPTTQLVPANAAHAHTAGAVALTQAHTLAAASAAHAHSADSPVVEYTASTITLSVADAAHALADTGGAGGTLLLPGIGLVGSGSYLLPGGLLGAAAGLELSATEPAAQAVAADASHALSDTGPLALTQAQTLAAQNAAHAVADTGPVALTQAHTLAAQSTAHGVSDTGPLDLTQANVLAAQSASHALSDTGPVSLTQAAVLAAQSTAHAHSSDAPALAQASTLTTESASHATSDTSPLTLDQSVDLAVADATHTQTAEAVVLLQAGSLAVAAATHAQSAGSVALTQASSLTASNAAHAQAAGAPSLTQANSLSAANAAHAQSAGSVGLTQASSLTTAGAAHAQAAEAVDLEQASTLEASDAAHAVADSAPITFAEGATLEAADAAHAHSAGSVALEQASTVTVGNAAHAHSVEAVALTQASILTASDAAHAQTAGTLTLTADGASTELVVSNAAHTTADSGGEATGDLLIPGVGLVSATSSVLLPGGMLEPASGFALSAAYPTELVVASAAHAHSSTAPNVSFAALLSVSNSAHAQAADSLSLTQVLSAGYALIPGVGIVPLDYDLLVPGALIGKSTGQTAGILAVDSCAVGHTADSIVLEPDYVAVISWIQLDTDPNALVVEDAVHSQYQWDTIQLTQQNTLSTSSASHAHSASLLSFWMVSAAAAAHAHSATKIGLDVDLRVFDARHEHRASGGDVVRLVLSLLLQNASHSHSATPTLASPGLTVHSAAHATFSTAPTLTQKFPAAILTMRDAAHAHAAEAVHLDPSYLLDPADAAHAQLSGEVLLDRWLTPANAGHAVFDTAEIAKDLAVESAEHAHAADSITLDVWQLEVSDAVHGHSVETVQFTQANVLGGLDAVHAHLVDSVWGFGAVWTKNVGRWQHWSKHTAGNGSWTPVGEAGNGWREVS